MFSIVQVAEKEIIEEGILVLQIKPAGGRVSCQRLTEEDGVEKYFGSLTAKVRVLLPGASLPFMSSCST